MVTYGACADDGAGVFLLGDVGLILSADEDGVIEEEVVGAVCEVDEEEDNQKEGEEDSLVPAMRTHLLNNVNHLIVVGQMGSALIVFAHLN